MSPKVFKSPAGARGAAHGLTVPMSLPAELTIFTVGDLRPQWVAWLEAQADSGSPDDEPQPVDASAVNQVDAAGLQLLLSLQRSLAEHGSALRLLAPSPALQQGCQALGLSEWLGALSLKTPSQQVTA